MSTIKELRRDLGITQEDLATLSGVSRDYIVKLEEVIYAEPSYYVVNYLSKEANISSKEIISQYKTDYYSKNHYFTNLADHSDRFDYEGAVGLMEDIDFTVNYRHPHTFFRTLLFKHYGLPASQVKYSKYTGVHPATVNKYELTKVKSIPRGCRTALIKTLSVPEEIVEYINTLGKERFDARN